MRQKLMTLTEITVDRIFDLTGAPAGGGDRQEAGAGGGGRRAGQGRGEHEIHGGGERMLHCVAAWFK